MSVDAGEKNATTRAATLEGAGQDGGMPATANAQSSESSGLQSMTNLLGEGADGVSCSVDGTCD
ncbi:hypothetical protein [uncultured Agrococcus sp.]|uniref:hypothetical protein n=1 Tax=uncultured Agrococcus sp. TaxID=382258 RepID=UPI0025D24439|nr:hypothetical protein [uncultured Agrococcus sp.]